MSFKYPTQTIQFSLHRVTPFSVFKTLEPQASSPSLFILYSAQFRWLINFFLQGTFRASFIVVWSYFISLIFSTFRRTEHSITKKCHWKEFKDVRFVSCQTFSKSPAIEQQMSQRPYFKVDEPVHESFY